MACKFQSWVGWFVGRLIICDIERQSDGREGGLQISCSRLDALAFINASGFKRLTFPPSYIAFGFDNFESSMRDHHALQWAGGTAFHRISAGASTDLCCCSIDLSDTFPRDSRSSDFHQSRSSFPRLIIRNAFAFLPSLLRGPLNESSGRNGVIATLGLRCAGLKIGE